MRYSILIALCAALGCGEKPASSVAVARVNGAAVLLSSYETQAERLAHVPGNDFSQPEKRKELMEEMVKEELLFQAAVKARMIEKSDRLKREIAREFLAQTLGKEKFEPSDDELKAYYETHKDQYDKVRASHILIKPKSTQDKASWDEAKTKIDAVQKKIRGDGAKADFAKYAKQFSEDSTKDAGGDLSFFVRSAMVKPFSDAAFSLKKIGDISDVVKSEYGYHIIKLTDEQRGVDFHKMMIKFQMTQQKRMARADELFGKLKESADIKIYDDVLDNAKVSSNTPTKPAIQAK